jgi:hypothetical protein
MPFPPVDPDHVPAPAIRGALRAELVRDLALGAETLDQLAVKFERSLDAIKQFSSRNKDEIRRAKQALVADPNDEYAGIAIAHKWDRISDAEQDLRDIIGLLEDGALTPSQRKHYIALKSKLRREVAEEKGELPVRSHLEVDVKSPFRLGDVMTYGPDGQLHEVVEKPDSQSELRRPGQ